MKKTPGYVAAGLTCLLAIPAVAVLAPIAPAKAAAYTAPKITMADGTQLVTIVRLPEGAGPFPTLIVRSQYTLPHTPLSGQPPEDLSKLPDADLPNTDLTVKIIDLAPDGTASLVTEGIQRARFRDGADQEVFLTPGQVYPLRIDLGHIAWRIQAGHQIAVDISSSNFPQWDRNLNTDQPLHSSSNQKVANNNVHHGLGGGSYVELPVVAELRQLKLLADFKTALGE